MKKLMELTAQDKSTKIQSHPLKQSKREKKTWSGKEQESAQDWHVTSNEKAVAFQAAQSCIGDLWNYAQNKLKIANFI